METKKLQAQIDKFYNETEYRLEVKDGRPYCKDILCLYGKRITALPDNLVVDGDLNLYGTKIAKLPDNLVVGGYLNLYDTKIAKLPDNLVVSSSLYLYDTKIAKLPNNLVVGGCLDLEGTKITELPNNLVVGGCLDIRRTDITKLPDNLVVGDDLYLNNTTITELPDNLVVGGNLYLYNTTITELPDNLVVGGYIWGMSNTPFLKTLSKEVKRKAQKINNFLQWEQGSTTYIEADGIFSVVDNHKGNVWVTHRIGKEETLYVVTDGEYHYAHGNTLKEAKADLIYKINDRDTSSYKNLSLDSELSFEEAIAMYRTITGACSAGTRNYIENRLPTPHKKKYSIKEVITLTTGEYGSDTFKNFFDKKK